MFQRFHELREKREGGFTLIELLVVILIIAILAAIAIPVFLRQREKGWVSQMESALKNGATAAESYATSQPTGNYAGLTEAKLTDEGFKKAEQVVIDKVTLAADNNAYCIQVHHSSFGATPTYALSSASSTPKKGTCSAVGLFVAAS